MDRKYDLEYFQSKNWFKVVRRENSAFLSSLLRLGSAIRNKELEFDNRMKHHMMLFDDVYSVTEEFEQLKNRMIRLAEKDSRFVERYISKLEDDCQRYLSVVRTLSRESKNDFEDKKLSMLFKNYVDESNRIVSHLWPPLAIEDYVVEKVEKGLARFIDPKDEFAEYKKVLQMLLSPNEPSVIQKRQLSILGLAVMMRSGELDENSEKVRREFRKYCWINDHGVKFDYESFDHFLKEIKKAEKKDPGRKLNESKKELGIIERQGNLLVRKYKFDKNLLYWSRQVEKMPRIRFLRIEVISEGAYILNGNLFEAICKKLGIKSLANYFHWEIQHALKTGQLDKKQASNREKAHNFSIIGKHIVEFDEDIANKLKNHIEKKDQGSSSIKGNIASMGYGKGEVKIIRSISEFSKFQNGNILVTSMTTPEYVPLMKKAVAIITDEGGISCHAAIVARELKKPCIIGTKIATQVLKDGDLVEVDAEKGIVKIIKK